MDHLLVYLCGHNERLGRHIAGVHVKYIVGQRNMEGRILLEFCL